MRRRARATALAYAVGITLIVLGESVLSATVALQAAFTETEHPLALITLGVGGLLILFSMWWIYFEQPAHERLTSLRASMRWGYGHYVVFASAAATGAGLAVAVDQDLHVAQDDLVAALATTVPVAVFVLVVWLLHLDHERIRRVSAAFPPAALLILATSFTPLPIHLTALVMVVLTGLLVTTRRTARFTSD